MLLLFKHEEALSTLKLHAVESQPIREEVKSGFALYWHLVTLK